jgi:PAS domain S-box-containing protein
MSDKLISKEIVELRQRLADAEETLRAITSGEVDALMVKTSLGERAFTLQGADTVYRIAIENVNEGVITLSLGGTILFSNHCFARMMRVKLNKIIGASIFDFVPDRHDLLADMLAQNSGRSEVSFRTGNGTTVLTLMATKKLLLDDFTICAVITELTEQKKSEEVVLLKERLEEKLASLKKTEEALRATVEKYETLFNSIDEGFCVIEVLFDASGQAKDYRFLEINPAFEKQTGLRKAKGKLIRDLAPAHEEYWFESYGRIALTGKPERLEHEARALDRYFEVYAFPIGEPQAHKVAVLFRDITNRKKADQALEQSNEKFRILSDANALLLASEDPEAIVSEIATNMMKHLDCEAFFNFILDEPTGRLRLNAYSGISAEVGRDIAWLDMGQAICGCVARDGKRIVLENIQENGDERAALVRSFGIQAYASYPLYTDSKTIGTISFGTRSRTRFTSDELGLIKTVADQVSVAMQRKRSEGALLRANRKVSEILESITDAFFALDGEWRFTYTNQRAADVIGLEPQELLGQKLWEKLPALAGTAHETNYRRAMAEQMPVHFEIPGLLSGSWNDVRVYPSPEGISVYWQDITSRKKTEEIKDEFIGLVSHELRTPLTVLIGCINVAMDEHASKEDRQELLLEANRSSQSLASILDNMLELSKYQAGRMSLVKKQVKLADVAERAALRVRQTYDTHEIMLDIRDGPSKVQFDAAKIEQVLYNLVENAVKYSPAGSWVRVFSKPDMNGLVVGVSDSGEGIAPEDQTNIFEPFVRLRGSGAKGVGLGLVVCKRLIEAHGGCIWVEPSSAEGCTFMFTLPGS